MYMYMYIHKSMYINIYIYIYIYIYIHEGVTAKPYKSDEGQSLGAERRAVKRAIKTSSTASPDRRSN